jgi:RNA polymerase sigma-70 factor (ECF subfamily)
MTESNLVHPDLFRRFQNGDQEAMCEIFAKFHKRLIAFVRLFTKNLEVAEEIAQETFLDAFKQRKEIRSGSSLRPWLFTVAKRKAIRWNSRKENALFLAFAEQDIEDLSEGFAPDQLRDVRIKQSGQILETAMEALNPRDRELVALRFFGGLQINEIAESMSIPLGSVGVFLNRSLERIRTALEKRGISPEDLME